MSWRIIARCLKREKSGNIRAAQIKCFSVFMPHCNFDCFLVYSFPEWKGERKVWKTKIPIWRRCGIPALCAKTARRRLPRDSRNPSPRMLPSPRLRNKHSNTQQSNTLCATVIPGEKQTTFGDASPNLASTGRKKNRSNRPKLYKSVRTFLCHCVLDYCEVEKL